MHPLFERASGKTHDVINAAIEIHKDKGPGLLESIYEWCLKMELRIRGFDVQSQNEVEVDWKQFRRRYSMKFDLLVDACLLVEVKAVQEIHPFHKAQLLSYMKLLDIPVGLVINFHELRLIDGVSRMILPGANRDSWEEEAKRKGQKK